MKILYFGSYNPFYARNLVLLKGLTRNGVQVLEISERGRLKYLKLFLKSLIHRGQECTIIGFPGQEVMFWLGRFLKRPLVFDVFTSHYGGYILDRGYFDKKSLRARYYRFLDKRACQEADIVLLDTETHIDFFVKEFGLPRFKFHRLFVGTDPHIFYPVKYETAAVGKFVVHFHGNYIPLQGTEYIIKAASLLVNEPIIFNLIGRGQTYEKTRKLADNLKLKNVNFLEPVSYDSLPNFINRADVCLGIFGDTPKTDLVIPNKVYEAIACQKAVITADTPAIRELFIDGENALLVNKADPRNLAEKILFLKNNIEERQKIATASYLLFKDKLTPQKLGAELVKIIGESR